MNVFVLIDAPPYDSSTVIGVYSTMELAEAARVKHATRPSGNVDPDYCIESYTLDVPFPVNDQPVTR